MKPNYVPLEDRVVVSLIEKKETKTESGIYIPDNGQEKPIIEGVIEAVGDGVRSKGEKINMYLKPGQKVVVYTSGVKYEMNGKKYRIIRQEEVVFIIDETTNQ